MGVEYQLQEIPQLLHLGLWEFSQGYQHRCRDLGSQGDSQLCRLPTNKTSNKNQTSDVHPRWVWKSGNSAQVTNLGIWEACRGFSRLCRLPTKNTLKRNQTSSSCCPQFLLSPRPPSLRCASPRESAELRARAFESAGKGDVLALWFHEIVYRVIKHKTMNLRDQFF